MTISLLLLLGPAACGQADGITPNTVRIQSTLDAAHGHWVEMTGFRELGSPTFSRDGKWIAFDAYRQGYDNSPSECWVARRDGKDLTRLAVGATPRWSPDGKRLLFMRDPFNDPTREGGIFAINPDGTGEVRIGDGRWPDWSPDGAQVVFSLGGERTGGLRVGARTWTARADGTGTRELGDGDCPNWSPDGKMIARCVRKPGEAPHIVVRHLASGKDENLGTGWFRANWSPFGRSLVANGLVDGKPAMVKKTVGKGDEQEIIPTDYERPSSPCVSWDGKEVVFIAKRPKEVRGS